LASSHSRLAAFSKSWVTVASNEIGIIFLSRRHER